MNTESPDECVDRCEPMVRPELSWKYKLQQIADDITMENPEPYFTPMDYEAKQKHKDHRQRQLKARERVLDAIDVLNSREPEEQHESSG